MMQNLSPTIMKRKNSYLKPTIEEVVFQNTELLADCGGLPDKILSFPFTHNAVTFSSLFLLGVVCIITNYQKPYYLLDLTNRCMEMFLEVYILTAVASVFPKKIRSALLILSLFVLYTMAVIDSFCQVRFNTTWSANIIQLLMETNKDEVSGFIKSYLTIDILNSSVGLILLIATVNIVVQCLFVENLSRCYSYILKNKLTLCLLLCMLVWGGRIMFVDKTNLFYYFKLKSTKEIVEFYLYDDARYRIDYLPVYRFLTSSYKYILSTRQIDSYISHYKNVKIGNCSFLSPNIVLVIGESYNKHHSQLYGYRMPTTPFQIEKKRERHLYVFNDAVTSHNLTSEVFKNMFSLNDCSNNEDWNDMPLFPQLFKAAGFNVFFISNQYVLSDYADSSAGAFINNKCISDELFCERNAVTHAYDAELLEEYNSMEMQLGKANLIIFHLIGQHISYEDRFPKVYPSLMEASYLRKDLNANELKILASYDNAVRYNDDVMQLIVQRFEKTNTIILYLSDHGEECYDEIKTFGRTHNHQPTKYILKNEFEIPFWIYCTEMYSKLHPDIVAAISSAIEKPFYSSDLGHVLLYLAGIKCKYYHEERNILISTYHSKRKRTVRGTVNYDEVR